MLRFEPDRDNPGHIWVDRGIDNKVTNFEPCDYCSGLLEARVQEHRHWQPLRLCDECTTRLEIEGAIDDVVNQGPIRIDSDLTLLCEHEPRPRPPAPEDPLFHDPFYFPYQGPDF